jgi:hypothetical protein
LLAVTCHLFGGIGWYPHTNGPDGQPWPMLHLDVRKMGTGHSRNHPLLWMRDGDGYHYIQYEAYAGKAVEAAQLLTQWAGHYVGYADDESE